jgi:hypothetical protein
MRPTPAAAQAAQLARRPAAPSLQLGALAYVACLDPATWRRLHRLTSPSRALKGSYPLASEPVWCGS